jgi:hypothetical protein
MKESVIRQVCSGRCVGAKLNIRDVSSRHAQVTKGIVLERLDKFDAEEGEWREALVEDRHAGPAQTAAARIDVAAWFLSLARKKRRITHDTPLLHRGCVMCVSGTWDHSTRVTRSSATTDTLIATFAICSSGVRS